MLNRTRTGFKAKDNGLDGWAKYLHENSLKVAWSLMLFVGGLIVLIYFAHIEFLPDIDLANATALLASAALIGAFIVFVFGAFFVCPGLALREILSCEYFSGFTKQMVQAESCPVSKTASRYVENFPLLRFTTFAAVVAAFLQVCTIFIPKSWWGPNMYMWLMYLALTVGALSFFTLIFIHERKSVPHRSLVFTILVCIWSIAGAFQLLPFIWAFREVDELTSAIYLFIWLVVIGFVNSLWGTNREKINWKLVGGVGFFTFFVLLMLASNVSLVSVSAMRVLGLGNVKNATLVLNKDGCSLIRNFAGNSACIGADELGPFVSKNITLLSRIGSEYLITACSNQKSVRIAIKKSDVIGWSAPDMAESAKINKSSGENGCSKVTEEAAQKPSKSHQ